MNLSLSHPLTIPLIFSFIPISSHYFNLLTPPLHLTIDFKPLLLSFPILLIVLIFLIFPHGLTILLIFTIIICRFIAYYCYFLVHQI
jgi:hypothetical protein